MLYYASFSYLLKASKIVEDVVLNAFHNYDRDYTPETVSDGCVTRLAIFAAAIILLITGCGRCN